MATIQTDRSGSWGDTATWVDGVVPGRGDIVTINTDHDVTISGERECASLSADGTTVFDTGGHLILRGGLTVAADAELATANSGEVNVDICPTVAGMTLQLGGKKTFDSLSIHGAPGGSGDSLVVIVLGGEIGINRKLRLYQCYTGSNHAEDKVTFDIAGRAVMFGGQLKRTVIASGALHAYGTKDEAGNTGVDFRLGRRRPMHRMARGCMVGTGLARN